MCSPFISDIWLCLPEWFAKFNDREISGSESKHTRSWSILNNWIFLLKIEENQQGNKLAEQDVSKYDGIDLKENSSTVGSQAPLVTLGIKNKL